MMTTSGLIWSIVWRGDRVPFPQCAALQPMLWQNTWIDWCRSQSKLQCQFLEIFLWRLGFWTLDYTCTYIQMLHCCIGGGGEISNCPLLTDGPDQGRGLAQLNVFWEKYREEMRKKSSFWMLSLVELKSLSEIFINKTHCEFCTTFFKSAVLTGKIWKCLIFWWWHSVSTNAFGLLWLSRRRNNLGSNIILYY